jgi:tetratricopeptide (TPR) repeat protein
MLKPLLDKDFKRKILMTPNRFTDALFQLIRSMEKSEKRHFKLYIKRSSSNENLKIIQLFDALDKMNDYDERILMKRLSPVTKPQLANLKAHLYKQLLASLRLLKTTVNIDLQLSELLDYARVLYYKGLKMQSFKMLERAKDLAKSNHKYNFLAQVISLEKKIETLHITRSSLEKTELLANEALDISTHIENVIKLSNLALLMYRWYVQNGHARNMEDEKGIRSFFKKMLPPNPEKITDFYERLYLYQSYCWYAFIRQDFLMYYRYSQKWVDLFEEEPHMKTVETGHYIKGMHTLLNALFNLRNYDVFQIVLKRFEKFAGTPPSDAHDNFRIHTFIYISAARLNWHLMTGSFSEGLKLIPAIEAGLEEYSSYVDLHRILVFNYKISMLYFGSGDYATCIDYLQRIIHEHGNLRIDLQCYARLLHLMAHFELGNDSIIESLTRSVYRFMAKMKNLSVVEEEIFKFIRNSFNLTPKKLKPELENFLYKIKHLEKNRFETRAFSYLDIVSWVESKVYEKPMSAILHDKYKRSKQRLKTPALS